MGKIKVSPIQTEAIFDYKVVNQKEQVPPGCLAVLEGYATLSDDRSNRNKHFYKAGFWDSVLNNNEFIKEKLATKTFFGSYRHPGKEESPVPEFGHISHNIRQYKVDQKGVHVIVDVLNTRDGRDIKPLIDYGSKIGISTRAFGEMELDKQGYKCPLLDKYFFITWDLVSMPAFSSTRMNKMTDSLSFEIDDSLMGVQSLEDVKDSIAQMEDSDARALCDYMGMCFDDIKMQDTSDSNTSVPTITHKPETEGEVEKALDDALEVIQKLEGQIKELEDAQVTVPVIDNQNTDLEKLQYSVSFLKDKVTDTDTMNYHLRQRVDSLLMQLGEKENTIRTLKDNLSDAYSDINCLQDQNIECEERIVTLSNRSDNVGNHISTTVGKKRVKPLLYAGDDNAHGLYDSMSGVKNVIVKLRKVK